MSEVPLPLLLLHGSVGVVVDDPRAALGGAGDHHLLDDLLDARGRRANGPGAGDAAEAAESTEDLLDLLARRRPVALAPAEDVVEDDDLSVADHGLARLREVERIDGDLLEVDVLPHVELRPVRQREDTDRLAGIDPRIVEVPQLGALVLRVPLTELVTEGEEPLLRARLFLVAPRAADGGVEAMVAEAGQESLRFEEAATILRAQVERVGARGDGRLIAPDQEVGADLLHVPVPELVHLGELVARVHVHQWKRDLAGLKGLLRQPEQARRVLADRVQKHRPLELRDHFPHHVDALGLEVPDMAERIGGGLRGHHAGLPMGCLRCPD